MVTAIWPVDLPPSALVGWTYVNEPNVVSGVLDKGRRRYTKARKIFSVSVMLTAAQLEIFQEFWEDGILDGAMPFTWQRPSDQVEADFLTQGPPQTQHVEGSEDNAVYRVSFVIKEVVLP